MSDPRPAVPFAPLDSNTLPLGHARGAPAPAQPATPVGAQTLSFGQSNPDLQQTINAAAQPAPAAGVANPDFVATAMPVRLAANPDLVATSMGARAATNPDFIATAAATPPPATTVPPASLPPGAQTTGRTTILPRLDGVPAGAPKLVSQSRPRYEPLKVLGKGGMGEVSLEVDRDIGRSVAIKRLLPQVGGEVGIARFVDEVRVMGRLEHPNIVPVHDVGLDEQGRYYFVMKHVEGETLEKIIERLRANDPETVRRFGASEARVELVMGVLRALHFAHARGFIHRDVKPANVMVGRYGEVMLMDWGIAKPVGEAAKASQPHDLPAVSGAADLAWATDAQPAQDSLRLSATHLGALVGTPAYMSPEQSRGENDRVDARSDLFSVTVMLRELLTLRHYLADAKSLDELLGMIQQDHPMFDATGDTFGVPAELAHYVQKGMQRDPANRFQSAQEMLDGLQGILEGRVHVQCPVTLTKRVFREGGRFVDRYPRIAVASTFTGVGVLLFGLVQMVRTLVF